MTRHDDGSSGGTVIVAFVLGALTGAAVALMMAPASGEATRRVLGDKAREGRDTLSSAIERGREAYEQARRGGNPPQVPPAPESL